MPLSLKLPEGCKLSNFKWNVEEDDDDDDDDGNDISGVSRKKPWILEGKELSTVLILICLFELACNDFKKLDVFRIRNSTNTSKIEILLDWKDLRIT